MKALLKRASLLALSPVLAASVANSAEPKPFQASEHLTPFILVCLQNYGNPAAQIEAAKNIQRLSKSDSWKLNSETKTGTTTSLSFEAGTVQIEHGGINRCSYSGNVNEQISVDQFGAAISQLMGGVSPTKRSGPPEEVVWVVELAGRPMLMSASTSTQANDNTVTLTVHNF